MMETTVSELGSAAKTNESDGSLEVSAVDSLFIAAESRG